MFSAIEEQDLPGGALLRRLADAGHYTDCFCTRVESAVDLETYLVAFYTTGVFKTERVILDWLASLPSSDADAAKLAEGSLDSFAAWTVTARAENQVLLTDVRGRTCSWLMSVSEDGATKLYFGSAVMRSTASTGIEPIKMTRLLMAFHRLYSKILLAAARRKLVKFARKSNY